MWKLLLCVFFASYLHYTVGYSGTIQLCRPNASKRTQTRGCTTQVLDPKYANVSDHCMLEFYPSNSAECKQMEFSPIKGCPGSIGGVSLKPDLLPINHGLSNYIQNFRATVLNITFTNIKWKTMKFRFQQARQNHCRNIVLSNNNTINDESVLYYDCYWSITDGDYKGQSHILDFEATDDKVVNRGQYYFNIPSVQMLSQTISEREWQPFLYIEMLPGYMRLHVNGPPAQLNINGYLIHVMKEDEQGLQKLKEATIKVKQNSTMDEVTRDDSLMNNGSYHYVVTPLHADCSVGNEPFCQHVESPRIKITTDAQPLNICIASIASLLVASLFIYYVALKVIRKYWCKDYIPTPSDQSKVLMFYTPNTQDHAAAVENLVTYIRNQFAISVAYDGDIATTAHRDPQKWAHEAFQAATHVVYVVGPADTKENMNKPPIKPYIGVDNLILSLINANIVKKKHVHLSTVYFDYSNGVVPVEMQKGKVFKLFGDWRKFIAYLLKNVVPANQIKKCTWDDLKPEKKKLENIC